MHLLAIIIFIVSSNLDNLVIGFSYGLKGIEIGASSNMMIGFLTFLGTVLSMALGKSLLYLIPLKWVSALGSGMIMLIGAYFLVSYLYKRTTGSAESEWPQENPEKFDRDQSKSIDVREAAALGVALTVNNMGLGIGASIMGLSIPVTSVGSCLCSLLCLHLGNRVGRSWLSRVIGKYAEPISGVLILLMGLWELLI